MPHLQPLYAFGSNGSGQLGIGHNEDVSMPMRCIFEDDPIPSSELSEAEFQKPVAAQVSKIAAGGNHTLLLLDDGRVYAAGERSDGRCGEVKVQNDNGTSGNRFRRISIQDAQSKTVFQRFKDVSATWEATMLVAALGDREDGDTESKMDKVFVLGSGAKGELGLGPGVQNAVAKTPVEIPDFPPQDTEVIAIASGMGHTVAVLSNGGVYGWGASRKGQLGDGLVGEKIVWRPTRIDGIGFPVTLATCGREFTALSGNNEKGEFVVLGSIGDRWGVLSNSPRGEDVKAYLSINASWHGVYVHQKDLSLLAWGRDDRGQLPPTEVKGVKEVAVGSEHVVTLLEDGRVAAWGWGEHGNCGPETDRQGNVRDVAACIPVPEGVEVNGVGAGCATSWIVGS
ncbi:regulator of chromosome condensation 1/beta-lactamase-inhibitor protein II [Aspergillus karnatakaensis]|uniref:RCC1 domain-containing protein n=1 Tax=Aspergillus karnatakaensis TaxID=1810916 RepID=UPI003CCCBE9A